jgi:hypothetical protein
VRSLGDRDQSSLAPSRLEVSEAGSVASSWRSVSDNYALRGYGPRFGPHFDGCTAYHSLRRIHRTNIDIPLASAVENAITTAKELLGYVSLAAAHQ